MYQIEFHGKLHRHIAQTAIGASAIRNQGAKGLVEKCRNYCECKIDLSEFFKALSSETDYKKFLDFHTEALLKLFPRRAKSWGAARKALNLFFRDLAYNKYFADEFSLPKDFHLNNDAIKNLEIPLDSYVVKGLQKHLNNGLPEWKSIKRLKKVDSDIYQMKAKELALDKHIARVHLDLEFWRKE